MNDVRTSHFILAAFIYMALAHQAQTNHRLKGGEWSGGKNTHRLVIYQITINKDLIRVQSVLINARGGSM